MLEHAEQSVAAHSAARGCRPDESVEQLTMLCEDQRRMHQAEYNRYNDMLAIALSIHNDVPHVE